jgi:dTDP-glucose 4,6-dehydratase
MDEKHPLQGQSPYSATKIGADMLAESFHRSFNLPVVIARPFNTYGPRQSARAVIPTIMSQLFHGDKKIKLGALHPRRDFNYVTDIVSGFLCIALCDKGIGQVINIGSGREISIQDLAKTTMRVTGINADIVCETKRLRPKKSEVDRLLCDASKAREWAGWAPQYSLEQGLAETAKWVQHNPKIFKVTQYNI